ncbi:hypothetical protein BLA29_011856, partial [Euroglyphus maynei]
DADDEDIRLPEPPANQTLAQWLAGGDLEYDDEDGGGGVINGDSNKPTMNDDLEGDNESSKNPGDNDQSMKTMDSSKSNRKRSSCTKELTDTVEMLTAEQARLGWTMDEGKSVTIGELYLLFCQPEKITLEYSWIIVDNEPAVCDEMQPKPLNTLQKFVIAANMTLMNYKKSTSNNTLSMPSNLRKRQANKSLSATTATTS